MVKSVSILGSTGSIGRQSLDIIDHLQIPVAALTAGTNVQRMAQQCWQYRPKLAVMATQAAAEELAKEISDLPTRISWGEEGLIEAATIPQADCVITAVVGMVGLKPTLAAIRAGKRIGLANKETLVCAGELVMDEAKCYGTEIIPVDSEHSAIFQCLMGCGDRREVKRIILTCSGGPFFGKSPEQLQTMTKADALRHPNWKMGAKITIDSATLMNKGFEVIEAIHLFGVRPEQVKVVVHRESIVHSAVEFVDNSIIAQMSVPDMRHCVQYALTHPERGEGTTEELDIFSVGKLTFQRPDPDTFILLNKAFEAIGLGGAVPAILNAANEEAVAAFLQKKIGFYDICEIVCLVVDSMQDCKTARQLDDILTCAKQARVLTQERISHAR